ncbi:class I SAM-dependent methyltransferase [Streptomyces tubbatahanensis]|uniref:Class I SAM-dependent methyltransferase n=1 Tax=Streptomyces tubbatahanensis TaxID=2923272 RepID=A0ABY3XVT3_9ACTN|nr:methyltransferase domain-containing protein [Streptomyces tubbatahanensis]UNS98485.1 class I SAM-dependent methyltransferase [Streptomyces tubbatahanensis]
MDVEVFAELLSPAGQSLLREVRGVTPAEELALATRLRQRYAPALVAAALTQNRLRTRAVAKFGATEAAALYFTADGLEQATRTSVADHRARRFAALGAGSAADLCCGVGADALALARAGIEVLAVDRDPLTCAVARANAHVLGLADRVEVRCADVADVSTAGYDALFADPARRGGRGRIFDPEAYSPPLSWAVEAALAAPLAALKVAPGIPHEAVPAQAQAEWVSHSGDVKEAVLWFTPGSGTAAAPLATLLPSGQTLAGRGLPDPPAGPVGRYLYEPDGAVVRAHLVADVAALLEGRLIDPTIAYVTTDAPPRAIPYATGYEITDVLPFHVKKLRALLRERGVGTVTVKKRGSAVEPEELRRKLKLDTKAARGSCTVFLTRVAGAPSMLLGHPLPREPR